jgi:molecular chaperone GrpE
MSDESANGSGDAGSEGAKSEPPKKVSSPPTSDAAASEGSLDEAAKSEEPKDPLEVAKADAQRYRDQLLRTAADFDNFRKRSRKEADDAARRGRDNLLKELLPVFDNLERAATSAAAATDAKSVAEGIKMVLRQFSNTLDRVGIQRVASVGQPFDPGLHEAIQHAESTEHPAGTITAEVQAGYQAGEHLVRAALVVVSKGPGPEGAPKAETEAEIEAKPDGDGEDGSPS